MSDLRIRVLVADDHTIVRKGLRALLGEYADI
jgi:DNA-binding NarL/FixJ family response regulator